MKGVKTFAKRAILAKEIWFAPLKIPTLERELLHVHVRMVMFPQLLGNVQKVSELAACNLYLSFL